MKILVVYYSRSGTTKKAAETIAKSLKCGSDEIKDVKNRKGLIGFIRSGRESAIKIVPKIKSSKINPKDYGLVIIGTPIWADTIASPVRAYLTKNKDSTPTPRAR